MSNIKMEEKETEEYNEALENAKKALQSAMHHIALADYCLAQYLPGKVTKHTRQELQVWTDKLIQCLQQMETLKK